MRIKKSLEDLKKERIHNNADKPITFFIHNKISPYLSYIFINFLPFTANQVTFMWGIVGIIGIFLMALGNYFSLLAGILIYQFAILFDMVDGDVARVSKKRNLGGSWLDTVIHYLHRGLMPLALGIGVYVNSHKVFYFYAGFATCLFLIFDNLNKLKVYETGVHKGRLDLLEKSRQVYVREGQRKFLVSGTLMQRIKAYAIAMLIPTDPFTLVFFAIVFNFVEFYLILMLFVSFVLYFVDFARIYKRMTIFISR